MNEKLIFVVDDEIQVLKLYKKAFEKKGYTVRTAETAEEALKILKNEKFKVMFLDLQLPGMNGLDLCREIRKETPDVFMFAVTGHADKFEFSDCLKAGFNVYFLKPMNFKIFYNTAEEAFEKLSTPLNLDQKEPG